MPSAVRFPDDPPVDMAGWCRYFGLPEDAHINSLVRHLMGNAAAIIGAKDLLIERLDERLKNSQSGGGNPLPPMTIEEGRRSTQRWGMGE